MRHTHTTLPVFLISNRRKIGALNDFKSEKLTSITVSQRATSIKYSDLIIVMDDGKIVGLGTHDDLIYSCDVYREICLSRHKGDDENE